MKNVKKLLHQISFTAGTLLAVVFGFALTTAVTHAAITSDLAVGSSGSAVTELQQFLATNSSIYPSRIISGYFGPLTQAAVVQFQVAYDISQVGRVGPMTRAKINELVSSGYGLDAKAPFIANLTVLANQNNATVSWTTSEASRGRVYFDTMPIRTRETSRRTEEPYISGNLSLNDEGYRTSQSFVISNLLPNTVYYYMTRAIDNSGNISVTMPGSFRTNQ